MRFLAFAIAVVLVAPALALAAAPREDTSLTLLRGRDQQLFAAGWRLAAANAPYCESAGPALGIAVLDAGSFGNPLAVRSQLGLSGDLAVGSVAPGSPAAAAGIAADDTLVALDGDALSERFPRKKPTWQRLIDVTAALDSAAAKGPVTLTLAKRGAPEQSVTVTGVPACSTRFEVLDSGGRASAEGTRVIFGRDFPRLRLSRGGVCRGSGARVRAQSAASSCGARRQGPLARQCPDDRARGRPADAMAARQCGLRSGGRDPVHGALGPGPRRRALPQPQSRRAGTNAPPRSAPKSQR